MRYILILLFLITHSIVSAIDVEKEFSARWQTHIDKVHPKEQQWLSEIEKEKGDLKKFLKDSKKIKETFYRLELFNPYFDRAKEVGMHPDNQDKNRYSKGAPYDDCRTLRHLKNFYISASDVLTEKQYYIITHAPMENTVKDFWRMIAETKAPLIVQLMSHSEGSARKYPRYLPTMDSPIKKEGYSVSLISQEVIGRSKTKEKDQLIKSVLRIDGKQGIDRKHGKEHIVTHLHYVNWPDGGVPQQDLFLELLKAVDNLKVNKDSPIVVHCVAGVGRSGMFAMTHTASKLLHNGSKNPLFAIIKTLVAMRMQRRGLLSRKSQFEFAVKALVESTKR